MADPQILIVGGNNHPPRKRGRPRSVEPKSTVCTWLPVRYHDLLIRLAAQHDQSVSATVRQLLLLRLK